MSKRWHPSFNRTLADNLFLSKLEPQSKTRTFLILIWSYEYAIPTAHSDTPTDQLGVKSQNKFFQLWMAINPKIFHDRNDFI